MDDRFAAAGLLFLPSVLLPTYFLKLPNSDPVWALAGCLLFLPISVVFALALHRDEFISEQVLILHKKYRRTDSLFKVLFDPRANLLLWIVGAFIGGYLGIHTSILWVALTQKPWIVAVPLAAYTIACGVALVVLVALQFVRYLQEILFLDEFAIMTHLPASKVIVRILAIVAGSELAGVVGFVYIGTFTVVYYFVYLVYLNYDWISEEPIVRYGLKIAGWGFVLLCVCNCITCLAMREIRRRRRRENAEREADPSTEVAN